MKQNAKHILAPLRAICAAIFLLCALTLVYVPAQAAVSKEQRVLRVGYFAFDGYHEMDDSGSRSGYGYELLQRMARYENITYEYVGYDATWEEMLQMLASGEIDFVSSARKTDERMESFDYSERNIGTRSTIITVRAGNSSIVAGDYSTYDGMTVGMLHSNTRNQSFEKYARERGFTYTPVYYETTGELRDALQNGEVDTVVSSSFRTIEDEWVLSSFDEDAVYIITRKGDTDTMALINDALEKMDIYDAGWRLELDEKYYGEMSSEEINLTPSEADYINTLANSCSPLKVAVNPDRYPYSFVEDGQLTGIMLDAFAEVADRLGLRYEICQTQTRQEYVDLLKTGTVDVCLDMHEDFSTAEAYGYKITDIYLSAPFSWIMRKGFSGEPHTVATVGASTAKSTTMTSDNVYGVKEYKYYDSFDECLKALRAGEVDAYYTYTYSAEKIVYEDEHNDLKTRFTTGASKFCIGVRQDIDVALLDALNKGVASLSDNDIDLITERYTVLDKLDFSFVRLAYEYPLVVVFLVLCVLLTCGCVVLTIRARYFKRQADAALVKAMKADEAKTTFLANMSHDIRTPINGIMGMLEIARTHLDDTDKVADCLNKMQSAARHLLSLINDVLDMSKIEAGAVQMESAPFDIRELISSCCSIVEGQQQDLHFECEEGPFEHPVLLGSELYLRRILINVLSNAVKYTPAGGNVTLRARETAFADGKASFTIAVEDTGIGIGQEFMEKLFDPFTQERSGSRSNYAGTGLGLAISKRLAEQMGGTLEAESTLGEGSTFTLTLTLPVAPQQERDPQEAVSADSDLHGLRILLAEDNDLNREIAEALLEENGCAVTAVADGAQAVEAYEAAPDSFDAILMDMMMPHVDGLEATRQIRAWEGKTPETGIPIIAMTANVFADDVRACLAAGMNSHVGKPVDMRKLAEEIARFTAQRKAKGG